MLNGTLKPNVKRFSLDTIKGRKPARVPLRITVNGVGGIGKTSLAAQFPEPIFIQSRGESGLQTLEAAGLAKADIMPFEHDGKTYLEAQSLQDCMDAIAWLTDEPHEFKTLAIDVMNGVERMLFEHVCKTQFGGDWGEKGFSGYGRGPECAMPVLKELLNALDRVRDAKGMTVLMLTHCKVKTFKNPTGPDYDKYVPDMHDKSWGLIFGWSDIVLFANRTVDVTTERGKSKGKAEDAYRTMHTDAGPAYDAKNRHNLPDEISMGDSAAECYANLVAALKESKAKGAVA